MRLGFLSAIVLALVGVSHVRAADIGTKPEELVGDWQITGNSLGDGKYIITFAASTNVTAKLIAGDSTNVKKGATWSYTEGRISFEGSIKLVDLKIQGTWVADWTNADEILITLADGHQFTLKRMAAKKGVQPGPPSPEK